MNAAHRALSPGNNGKTQYLGFLSLSKVADGKSLKDPLQKDKGKLKNKCLETKL